MKPNFALSLSFQGITLLHRAADGWRIVGEVTLDVADLTAEIEALRTHAVDLAGEPVRCKIVIPNDQIRYLTIQTGSFLGETRREMARAALEGATPYDVADLAFDLSHADGDTHIAAVARETLQEAESFARTHGFEPVSFVAMPEEAMFKGEPVFDVIGDAALIDRSDDPIEIIGPATETAPAPDGPASEPPVETQESPTDDKSEPNSAIAENTPDQPEKAPLPDAPDPEQEMTPEPSAGFASRRRKPDDSGTAPPLAGARRDDPPSVLKALTPQEPDDAETAKTTPGSPLASPVADSPKVDKQTEPEPSFAARFLSRRKPRETSAPRSARATKNVVPAPPPQTFETETESDRMTIFGAREKPEVGGKPRHLGLYLTIGLLIFLAAVAAWSALFMDDRISALFGGAPEETATVAPPTIHAPEVLTTAPDMTDAGSEADVAPGVVAPDDADDRTALLPGAETEIAPEPDAEIDAPESQAAMDEESLYAATGIWSRAPEAPQPHEGAELNELYDVSIDRRDLSTDAVALPPVAQLDTDQSPASVASPAEAGTAFDLDERGLVRPSAEGALNPDGVLVFLGRPPVVPPETPTRFETNPEAEIDAQRDRLAAFRPQTRPENLAELTERSQLGGLTRSELAGLRPKLRPETVKREAEQDETPTAQAIVVSRTPKGRPSNFGAKVAQARQRSSGPSEQVASAATATVAPRTVAPRIPSSASVARQATVNNAINLRQINLIGVYGTPSNRRALIRLPSGRYKKVQVGDNVDGGRIVAIGDSELRYQKGGRNMTLKIPSS